MARPRKPGGRFKRLEDKIERMKRLGTYIVAIKVKESTETLIRGPKNNKTTITRQRSAGENARAINAQAKAGRNVKKLKKIELEKMVDIFRNAKQTISESPNVDAAMNRVLSDIAAYLKTLIIYKFDKAPGFKPVLPSTDAQKKRETGKDNLPPLTRSGAMQDGMFVDFGKLTK